MRNIVSVSLDEALLNKLNQLAKEENTSRSEIIKKSLQKMFFSTEFNKLRNKAMGELAKKGIVLIEEDVFKEIS